MTFILQYYLIATMIVISIIVIVCIVSVEEAINRIAYRYTRRYAMITKLKILLAVVLAACFGYIFAII